MESDVAACFQSDVVTNTARLFPSTRWTTIGAPSGDHCGHSSETPEVGVCASSRRAEPSAWITQTRSPLGNKSHVNAISLPSGDHAGALRQMPPAPVRSARNPSPLRRRRHASAASRRS